VVIQLAGADGSDERVDQGRELLLRADDDAGLALLELDGLGSELDGHDDLTGRVGLPPGPDRLLFGGGLTLPVDLGPPLYGPDVVGVFQQQLLLLQLGHELGPAHMDGVVAGLRQAVNESDLRTGIWVLRCWINPPDPNRVHDTVHAAQIQSELPHRILGRSMRAPVSAARRSRRSSCAVTRNDGVGRSNLSYGTGTYQFFR
jgi:hypothetical protein